MENTKGPANDPQAAVSKHPRWDRLRNEGIEGLAYRLVSDENEHVPLNWASITVDDQGCKRVFAFLNDSSEIGIGWPSEWHATIRREAIHKFIRWYLWKWGWGEWFGLRRWIFYKLIHRRVERMRRQLPPQGTHRFGDYRRDGPPS